MTPREIADTPWLVIAAIVVIATIGVLIVWGASHNPEVAVPIDNGTHRTHQP